MVTKQYSVYLGRMLDAIHSIQTYTKGVSEQDFLPNPLLIDAYLMQLQHIGETVAQIEKHFGGGDIADKKEIIGFRNLISHQYRAIRAGFVRTIIQQKLPRLQSHIQSLL